MAKDGASVHAAPEAVSKRITSEYALVKSVGSHLAAVVCASSKLFKSNDIRIPKKPRSSGNKRPPWFARVLFRTSQPSSREGGVKVKHIPFFMNGKVHCKVCLSAASSYSSIKNFMFAACRGSVMSRLGDVVSSSSAPDVSLISTGHSIAMVGPILWCTRCIRIAESKVAKLSQPCPGNFNPSIERWKETHRKRLAAGKHPVTGRTLPTLMLSLIHI